MPPRILVVEDEEEYRLLLSRLLAEAGYEVSAAATGGEGLRLAAEQGPELILLDVMLPDMTGFDFCRQFRAARARVPILFCTVRSAVQSLARGLKSGGTDYVIKPFVPEDLLARVRAALAGAGGGVGA